MTIFYYVFLLKSLKHILYKIRFQNKIIILFSNLLIHKYLYETHNKFDYSTIKIYIKKNKTYKLTTIVLS